MGLAPPRDADPAWTATVQPTEALKDECRKEETHKAQAVGGKAGEREVV